MESLFKKAIACRIRVPEHPRSLPLGQAIKVSPQEAGACRLLAWKTAFQDDAPSGVKYSLPTPKSPYDRSAMNCLLAS